MPYPSHHQPRHKPNRYDKEGIGLEEGVNTEGLLESLERAAQDGVVLETKLRHMMGEINESSDSRSVVDEDMEEIEDSAAEGIMEEEEMEEESEDAEEEEVLDGSEEAEEEDVQEESEDIEDDGADDEEGNNGQWTEKPALARKNWMTSQSHQRSYRVEIAALPIKRTVISSAAQISRVIQQLVTANLGRWPSLVQANSITNVKRGGGQLRLNSFLLSPTLARPMRPLITVFFGMEKFTPVKRSLREPSSSGALNVKLLDIRTMAVTLL